MRNLLIAMLIIALPVVSNAQNKSYRSDRWDVSLSAVFQDSKFIGSDAGSSIDVNSDTGFGINFAYNWNSRLAFGADFEFLNPSYSAILVDDTGAEDDLVINHKMSQFTGRLKASFNLLEGPFTPFVEGGIGWTNFDSNVADGPPQTGCWWHPYWGYICENYYRTFSDTMFSYGAGVGLRFEFGMGGFVKASYNYWEMDGLGAADDSAFTAARIEIGSSF